MERGQFKRKVIMLCKIKIDTEFLSFVFLKEMRNNVSADL